MANEVSPENIQNAAGILRAVLEAKITDGDFSEGSSISDLVIDPNSIIYALIQNLITDLKTKQSLLKLRNAPNDTDTSDAVDAILSNLYCSRSQGSFARGTAIIHFSQKVDVPINRNTRFFKTQSNVFYLDSDADLFIAAEDLKPNVNSSGQIIDWTCNVFLKAARVGEEYNLDKGRFVGYDKFNAFVTYIENATKFSQGLNVQSSKDFIDDSEDAISLRALINARSNNALLKKVFPLIEKITTIDYGSPEMVRDIIKQLASKISLHIGGSTDIYIRLALQENVERVIVQELTPRADGRAFIFRDTGNDFIANNVVAGDVLIINAGVPEVPKQYKIVKINSSNELEISTQVPFKYITDEENPVPALAYSIGNNYPNYNNKLNILVPTANATTSRSEAKKNTIVLSGRPLYRIKKIELLSSFGALEPYRDATTQSILFKDRVNKEITTVPPIGSELKYRVVIKNQEESQSQLAVNTVELGWPAIDLIGQEIEVTYDTLGGFDTVHNYVISDDNRPTGANTLVRAEHPIYVNFIVQYKLRASVTDTASVELDDTTVENELIDYINNYTDSETMDVSILTSKIRELAPNISTIYPIVINYDLFLPDGRVIKFQTTDKITVKPSADDGVTILNASDFNLTSTDFLGLLNILLLQGVSDRNIRYLAVEDTITFIRKLT